jgi:predicted ATP-grasp superfamily ATP-dependent carboligase
MTIADSSQDAPARRSRYCADFRVYPSPLDNVEDFRKWLIRTVSSNEYELLVGTTEFTIPLISEWRQELEPHVQIPLPDHTTLKSAFDKSVVTRLAQDLNLTIPPTTFIDDWEKFEKVTRKNRQWPLIIKPRSSVGCKDGRRFGLSVQYAFDPDALRRIYYDLCEQTSWPMLQSYVSGRGVGCFFLIQKGNVVARFQHQRIRDTNPTGSRSSLRVSSSADLSLMDASERLLRAMGWEGLAMVEYRVDSDGTPYFMEVNPRPWGSIQLAVEAGVDFPLMWYRGVVGQTIEEVKSYHHGIACRYLVGDLTHLESVLRGPSPDWRLPYPRRLRTLVNFFKFWGRNMRYDDFAAEDWRPGFYGLKNYFLGLCERIGRKLRRSEPSSKRS